MQAVTALSGSWGREQEARDQGRIGPGSGLFAADNHTPSTVAERPVTPMNQLVGVDARRRPSCSSIRSRSNIKLKEVCLPSWKRSTWM
jgi:hypothetical protein